MKLIITRQVTSKIDLTRLPTKDDIYLLKNRDLFDFEEEFINWNSEEIIEEDYSGAGIEVIDEKGNIILEIPYTRNY